MGKEIIEVIRGLQDIRRPFAVATVVETEGSVSAKTSSKAVIDQKGKVVAGWVGGGCAESATCQKALDCMQSGETAVLDIDLNDEMLGAGMPCGGSMRVYVEPVLPEPALWIMGHGRVAEVLCVFGDLLGLEVIVNDPAVDREQYPAASRLITDDIDYAQLDPAQGDYVVIATQHKGDHESMQRALASPAAYIALIASRKRSGLVMDYLQEAGFDARQLERVMAPSGLDLGARTPEEIALCVISEIVLLRRGGSGLRMRDKLSQERTDPLRYAGMKS
ncbi:MAG: XdhC family protein [Gammaproteobacteria bacterium]|nr:XdhC family protein [Gammaproteobacteria bacterium]